MVQQPAEDRSKLEEIAHAPFRFEARLLLGVISAVALGMAGLTDGRSLLLLVVPGLVLVLHGRGLLTNWAGVWDAHVAHERRRVEQSESRPLAKTKLGKAAIAVNRQDHESVRGFQGLMQMFFGAGCIGVGIVSIFGVLG